MAYWSGGPSGWSNDKGTRNTRHADDWVDYYAEIYNWKLITRFFPFIKQHKKRMYLTIISMLIATIAAYLQPFIMGIGVEKISDSTKTIAEKSSELNIIVILLIATTIITMVAQSFQRYNIGFIGQNILLDLRVNLFKHFNKLSMSFSEPRSACIATTFTSETCSISLFTKLIFS